jgi:hypothetical protein
MANLLTDSMIEASLAKPLGPGVRTPARWQLGEGY